MQLCCRATRILYTVEHRSLTGTTVNTRCHHETDLIEQPCRKERTIDVSATGDTSNLERDEA